MATTTTPDDLHARFLAELTYVRAVLITGVIAEHPHRSVTTVAMLARAIASELLTDERIAQAIRELKDHGLVEQLGDGLITHGLAER